MRSIREMPGTNEDAAKERVWHALWKSRGLLRLRGEFGVLRSEKNEASQLRADNSRMRSNLVEKIIGGKKLTIAQVEPYLKANHRDAGSLIAAAHVTGDLSLLREALEKYPEDPRANFTALFALKDEFTPAERRQRLEAFKAAAPHNALADHLSAQEYFKAGQMDRAVQDLVAASGKPGFQDYYSELVQNTAAAYRPAGLSSLEAAQAACGQPIPHLADLKSLGQNLVGLAKTYLEGGDDTSAQAAVQMGVTLGRRLGESAPHGTVISQLVGAAIERQVLEAFDPASPYDAAGHSVNDRLAELLREREEIKTLFQKGDGILRSLSAPELIGSYDRMRTAGELEAMRWVVNREQNP